MYYFMIILITIIVYIIYQYNQFIHLKSKIKQAKSGIDVYLTQRFDLIPNLVECVKSYATYEQTIFKSITKARTQYMQTKSLKDGEIVNQQCNTILGMSEKYPKLKSNEQFLNLQKNLTKMESQLQAARRIYNSEVTCYNIKLNSFPTSFIGHALNLKDEDLFEAEDTANNVVNVNL